MTSELDDSDPDAPVAVEFQEKYWRDRGKGGPRPLSEYLALFPEHRNVVIREYLAAEGVVQTLPDATAPLRVRRRPRRESRWGPTASCARSAVADRAPSTSPRTSASDARSRSRCSRRLAISGRTPSCDSTAKPRSHRASTTRGSARSSTSVAPTGSRTSRCATSRERASPGSSPRRANRAPRS